jgi:putrescine transport system ATP-binding protein
VAKFIGNINLLPGVVSSVGEVTVIDAGQSGMVSVSGHQSRAGPGDKVYLAIRPEKMRISSEAPGEGCNGLHGKLIADSYAGDRSYYYLDVPGLSARLTVANLNERRTTARSIAGNAENVWAVWPIDSGLLLTS